MTAKSLHELEQIFISKLQELQTANDGQPAVRTLSEWCNATGLNEEELTNVRRSLQARGALHVEVVSALADFIGRPHADAVE